MNYSIGLNASGNEVTSFYDAPMCGDFAGCHEEPPTCRCDDRDAPPIGIVTAVQWWTLRENVAYTVARIREQRESGGPFETLFLNDLRALLASREAQR